MRHFALILVFVLGLCVAPLSSQVNQTFPASTQTLLRGVKSQESQGVIKSVLKIVCPKDNAKGTGFVVSGGSVIVTNSHVVGRCTAQELIGTSAITTAPIRFTAAQIDNNRDLAILCANTTLPFSLKLDGDQQPIVETEIETWGYPLIHEDPAPLLSRGYVAGYSENVRQPGAAPVKRLIVNGALNPGNSGGPLIDRGTGKVIGIVVEKWTLWSPNIEVAIKGFAQRPTASFGSQFVSSSGEQITNEQMLAVVIKEFYDKSQVMVGEAISVSELNSFLKEKQKDLACAAH